MIDSHSLTHFNRGNESLRWLGVLLGASLVHVTLFFTVSISPSPIPETTSLVRLQFSFAPDEFVPEVAPTEPPKLKAASEAKTKLEEKPVTQQLLPPETDKPLDPLKDDPTLKPLEESPKTETPPKREHEVPEKSLLAQLPEPVPQKKEEPKPQEQPLEEKKDEPAKAPPPADLSQDFERIRPSVADDTSANLEDAPPDALLRGATNSLAADQGPLYLPKGGPYNEKGETSEILTAGRRGETDEQLAERADPLSGSVARQGSEEAGRPEKPDLFEAIKALKPEPAPPEKRLPEKTELPQEIERDAAPDAKISEAMGKGIPEPKRDLPQLEPQSQASAQAVVEVLKPLPLQEGQETALPLLEGEGTLETKSKTELERAIETLPPEQKTEVAMVQVSGQAVQERDRLKETMQKRQPEANEALQPVEDPELKRLRELLELKTGSFASENMLDRPGIAAREGRDGHEGDGRKREGQTRASSDIVTINLSSSAHNIGEMAFTKSQDPVIAYMKPFFTRIDTKWKANLHATVARTQLLVGNVGIRIKLKKDGTLLSAVEASRSPSITDSAVVLCERAVKDAAPNDPFPPALADREELELVIQFLYR